MSSADVEGRPAKKRRFFVDEEPELRTSSVDSTIAATALTSLQDHDTLQDTNGIAAENGFDSETLSAVVGEALSDAVISRLQQLSGGNLERGMSIFVKHRDRI
jgi:DNA repair protein RAD5